MANAPVDLRIPETLSKINRNFTSAQQKAALFNLVIYAHEARRVAYFEELIRTILVKFPCRILFIQADSEEQEHFLVEVTGVMSGVGKEQTLCDQITIKSSKKQMARVPSLLYPALLPDLPLYLLWGQSPFEEHLIFPSLQPYASRVIIDAECFDSLSLFCRQMEANLKLLKMDLMDMNWALVSNWRDLLYKIFNSSEKIELLPKLKSAIIKYNSYTTETIKHPEIRALYLQAWLAACLECRYRKAETFENNLLISYFGKSYPFVVALEPMEESHRRPGSIVEVSLTFVTGDSIWIWSHPTAAQALVHESSVETCALPYTLPLPNVYAGSAFLNEILYQRAGEDYHNMLRMISQL